MIQGCFSPEARPAGGRPPIAAEKPEITEWTGVVQEPAELPIPRRVPHPEAFAMVKATHGPE